MDSPGLSAIDKEREMRLYLVIRADLALTPPELARVAAQATWRTLAAAIARAPERLARYSGSAQPKIALRVKSRSALERTLAAARLAGLPAELVDAALRVPAAIGVGPVARAELPDAIRKLQILTDPTPTATPVPEVGEPATALRLWLLVRGDLPIPYGKLASQAGHGAWTTLRSALRTIPDQVAAWDAGGAPVAMRVVPDVEAMARFHSAARAASLPAAFIVDAGRTVFSDPTPTVVGIGPCTAQAFTQVAERVERG